MPKFTTRQVPVKRKTYLKGKFKGKFSGTVDTIMSDRVRENFYDLEWLSGECEFNEADIRKWQDGGEFEDFVKVDEFPLLYNRVLPSLISHSDGTEQNYSLEIHEPKLSNIRLLKQRYEPDQLFVTVEGDLGGYLLHDDHEVVTIEVPEAPVPAEEHALEAVEHASRTSTSSGDGSPGNREGTGTTQPDLETNQRNPEKLPLARTLEQVASPTIGQMGVRGAWHELTNLIQSEKWSSSPLARRIKAQSRLIRRHPLVRPLRLGATWLGKRVWPHRRTWHSQSPLEGCFVGLMTFLIGLYLAVIGIALITAITSVAFVLFPVLFKLLSSLAVAILLLLVAYLVPKNFNWILAAVLSIYLVFILLSR
jgi:hypothetical protein